MDEIRRIGLFPLKTIVMSAMLGAVPVPGHAQEQDASEGSRPTGALEEIIVTAQRRSENLERTPVSVLVLSSKALEQQAVLSVADLQIAVPGVTVRTTNDSNTLNFSIRGQTLDSFTGSQPAVQPYFNEVPVTAILNSAFYDMDSIQVLKGPQGTLFGRNVTGGAILFSSAKPTDTLGGYLLTRLGDYGREDVQVALNTPLSGDKLILRIAGDFDRRDGFTYNSFDGSTFGNFKKDSARITLLAKPSERLTDTLS